MVASLRPLGEAFQRGGERGIATASEQGTSSTAAYPVRWLGMAPKESTAIYPVRPCLVQESHDVGNAMTANSRS
ncbi:MAG: hypothetical protein C7B45_14290 [Sulfobacillus acidophilus]|uniref:Uncharacterized protein n=1 Tax=Sulfobacillus acidophilus TaxID=53633 RepID=A0A2T2WEB1_9FIRM|nr:MAG: hypothetical protein C7B45_14290 [Sulfobacillus acidophilus]